MKKIPTLFERQFENHKIVGISDKVIPGLEWVLEGKGVATVKIDGACCAIFDGVFYKRFDAKNGRKPPAGAIPCCDPDPVTGHWPHWVKVDANNPADKWLIDAYANSTFKGIADNKTYEAVGPHFNGNPYGVFQDYLIQHGKAIANVERTFADIRDYLEHHHIEGLVFWLDGEPMCKIKRTDFGFAWPAKYGGQP